MEDFVPQRVTDQDDDFEKEVEALRNSQDFQRFLDERSCSAGRIPLDEIEADGRRQGKS